MYVTALYFGVSLYETNGWKQMAKAWKCHSQQMIWHVDGMKTLLKVLSSSQIIFDVYNRMLMKSYFLTLVQASDTNW